MCYALGRGGVAAEGYGSFPVCAETVRPLYNLSGKTHFPYNVGEYFAVDPVERALYVECYERKSQFYSPCPVDAFDKNDNGLL